MSCTGKCPWLINFCSATHSLPQTNGISVSILDLSLLSADLYQSNATAVADEGIHQHPPISLEGNDLEEPLSQPRSQSRTEARLSLTVRPRWQDGGVPYLVGGPYQNLLRPT